MKVAAPPALSELINEFVASRESAAAAQARAQEQEAAFEAAQATVIEPVTHPDSAMMIKPGEASDIAHETWAGSVERLADADAPLLTPSASRAVLVLKFIRSSM